MVTTPETTAPIVSADATSPKPPCDTRIYFEDLIADLRRRHPEARDEATRRRERIGYFTMCEGLIDMFQRDFILHAVECVECAPLFPEEVTNIKLLWAWLPECSMNMEKQPTKKQLQELLASVNDNDARHVIWVDVHGGVHLDPWHDDMRGELIWDGPAARFKLESYGQGYGYVGEKASRDLRWVGHLFHGLVSAWDRGETGYIDAY